MQFSDYQHPEWCEETKFTPVKIEGETVAPISPLKQANKICFDFTKEVTQEYFDEVINKLNNIKSYLPGPEFTTILYAYGDGIPTHVPGTSAPSDYSAKVVLIARNGLILLLITAGRLTDESETMGLYSVCNNEQTAKNMVVPAYTWVKMPPEALGQELNTVDVELCNGIVEYELDPVGSKNMLSELEISIANEHKAEIDEFINYLNTIHATVETEVKEPVFNFTTNCNLFIDNMR